MTDANIFNVEHQYQSYLGRMGLRESSMGDIQRVETRRAFIGGFGQALLCLRDDIGRIDDEMEAVKILADITQQCINYWKKEARNAGIEPEQKGRSSEES